MGPWKAMEKRPLRQRTGFKAGDEKELLAPPPKKEMRPQVSGAGIQQDWGSWYQKKKKVFDPRVVQGLHAMASLRSQHASFMGKAEEEQLRIGVSELRGMGSVTRVSATSGVDPTLPLRGCLRKTHHTFPTALVKWSGMFHLHLPMIT